MQRLRSFSCLYIKEACVLIKKSTMIIKQLLFLFICISCGSFAQIKWGVKVGLQYSNIIANDRDGNKVQSSPVPGICLGGEFKYSAIEQVCN